MARRPVSYQPSELHPLQGERAYAVRTGPATALPSTFEVRAVVGDLHIHLDARVNPGGHVRVVSLSVWVPPEHIMSGAVTSTALRRDVLVDELIRRATALLEFSWEPSSAAPGAFTTADLPEGTAWTGAPAGAVRRTKAELVTEAARAYNAAVAAGDSAPTMAAANVLGYSRSQTSRLVAQARREGMIPAHSRRK